MTTFERYQKDYQKKREEFIHLEATKKILGITKKLEKADYTELEFYTGVIGIEGSLPEITKEICEFLDKNNIPYITHGDYKIEIPLQ